MNCVKETCERVFVNGVRFSLEWDVIFNNLEGFTEELVTTPRSIDLEENSMKLSVILDYFSFRFISSKS